MRFGFIIPDFQGVSTIQIVDLAREAEFSGWDAIFFRDGDWGFSRVGVGANHRLSRRASRREITHGSPSRRVLASQARIDLPACDAITE